MTPHAQKDLVLVVDDSPGSLGMINDTLDEAGLTVLVALEGAQALNITQSITPDIILMDAIMPGMDGFDTCRHLKSNANLEHTPIIFMTGLSDTESIIKGFNAGGIDYVQKPVNSSELIARIKAHLNNARLTQSARMALDASGQFLITTDQTGEFKWATPQAYQLLHQADLSESWLKEKLSEALEGFFSSRFNKDKNIQIHQSSKTIELAYIGQDTKNNHLFRIIDLELTQEQPILQAAFQLTVREAEVLTWLAKGKSNADIALILSVSPNTINAHLAQIFKKLNVENRTSAAIVAINKIRKATL
ncbi:DNA-binding response regulator [Marinomonas posidonica]|uniref:Two component transcriptional regulator, LuxR family n=1 Tax=Marinomonas posidonica (strain CECT 7376 / NCIMB 14433 / IVIA-Po-181) TaxID=491952 RepID=F6D0A0_MARPP|nr:DNA-binding response regulator [Marinomonas posidonica]AEF53622.1 two component transcriptional regulator, LuxR family [Marinomonas posidonica IVIA-Po-181]